MGEGRVLEKKSMIRYMPRAHTAYIYIPFWRMKGFNGDDDCFYYHSWRNNVVIAFGTLSSFLT